ncbi:MAG: ABC transporter permease [Chloroflexi bacterium]|nr:ABC transporter permease [Chloroflexota bacterium]
MRSLLAAEFLKLRTTSTAWALLGATLVITAVAVAAAVIVASDNTNMDLESARGVRTVLHVSASGAIFVLILGIIISAGEHRQGTAIDTFLTTPARWRVIATKLATGALTGVLFGGLSVGVAVAVASHTYGLKGYSFSLDSAMAWSILGGAVLYAILFGVLGTALGSLLRNQVGAIVGALAWLFVAEQIVFQLAPALGKWLPGAAGRALVRDPNADLLTQPSAAVVLALYGAAIVAGALLVERYRDV